MHMTIFIFLISLVSIIILSLLFYNLIRSNYKMLIIISSISLLFVINLIIMDLVFNVSSIII